MNAENILALIGICLTCTGGLAAVAFGLARSYLADHETRLRRVEAAVSECVRRSDLDELRRELAQSIEKMSEQLREALTEPRTPSRRRRA